MPLSRHLVFEVLVSVGFLTASWGLWKAGEAGGWVTLPPGLWSRVSDIRLVATPPGAVLRGRHYPPGLVSEANRSQRSRIGGAGGLRDCRQPSPAPPIQRGLSF